MYANAQMIHKRLMGWYALQEPLVNFYEQAYNNVKVQRQSTLQQKTAALLRVTLSTVLPTLEWENSPAAYALTWTLIRTAKLTYS